MSTSANPHQISVSLLSGVGQRTAERLAKLDIHSLQDLLFHLPSRYQDRTRITAIGSLYEGSQVLIEGTVLACDVVPGRRRSLLCRIEDSTGITSLRFYYFSASLRSELQRGRQLRCFGEVRRGSTGLELYHPECQLDQLGQLAPLQGSLTPIYPTTEGISQNKLRQLITQALSQLSSTIELPELLPSSTRFPEQFQDISAALQFLHCPPAQALSMQDLQLLTQQRHPAQLRLALEELVAHQLSLLQLRQRIRKKTAPALLQSSQLQQAFLSSLPFPLTAAQQRVIAEINQDLAFDHPMLRLIQGDVGSGKTLVAALAALTAVASGFQAAIMAPTEILAEQHFNNFQQWMQPLDIEVAWLTGKQPAAIRRQNSEIIASGQAGIVIGTHALFQKDVAFKRLALIIIDEQHRFGVHQRLELLNKGHAEHGVAHQLIMTATPIPRTLAMSAYADLDCSIIDELPPGRSPVETIAISSDRRDQVVQRVREACNNGRQAYWVCTLIEESEALECQAAEVTAEQLTEQLPELNIGLIHGRLKTPEKAAIMAQFKAGELNLLVATTVIEVGVDVANASLMIIENPERLGLSQLHQLRGRVGRGAQQSFCVLMYSMPLSRNGRERLKIMRESSDGFVIAEKDLELRGPGEVLGTKQTGIMSFKVADFELSTELMPQTQACASDILTHHRQHIDALIVRWLGSSQRFGKV
ncbi:MAG: ATP-dependent DNA helicase RecG [Pseudomonadales bacterium]